VLLFSFFVILGHSFIPHHHHADLVVDPHTTSCPTDDNDPQGPDQMPLHCHAFNEIAYYKVTLPGTVKPLTVPCMFNTFNTVSEPVMHDHTITGRIMPLKIPVSFILFGRTTVHRGPPAILVS